MKHLQRLHRKAQGSRRGRRRWQPDACVRKRQGPLRRGVATSSRGKGAKGNHLGRARGRSGRHQARRRNKKRSLKRGRRARRRRARRRERAEGERSEAPLARPSLAALLITTAATARIGWPRECEWRGSPEAPEEGPEGEWRRPHDQPPIGRDNSRKTTHTPFPHATAEGRESSPPQQQPDSTRRPTVVTKTIITRVTIITCWWPRGSPGKFGRLKS